MRGTRKPRRAAIGHRYGGSAHGAPGTTVSYGDVGAEALHRTVAAVCAAGDAITFGRTSDGGAFYFGVLADGLLEKFYVGASEDVEGVLRGIAEAGEALVE